MKSLSFLAWNMYETYETEKDYGPHFENSPYESYVDVQQ